MFADLMLRGPFHLKIDAHEDGTIACSLQAVRSAYSLPSAASERR